MPVWAVRPCRGPPAESHRDETGKKRRDLMSWADRPITETS